MVKKPRIVCFYIFLTGTRLNNLIPDNVMGLKKKNENVHVKVVLLRLLRSFIP